MFQGAREKLIGRTPIELLDAFTAPTSPTTDLPYKTRDGSIAWIRVTAHVLENDLGQPISIIGKVTLIDDEIRAHRDLSLRATHDGLTGLLNQKAFKERAEKELDQGHVPAFMIIDVDDFKLVNDTYGHLTGDRALQRVAAALGRSFRSSDLLGRIGGDEFAVCMCGRVDKHQLENRCAEIVQRGVNYQDDDGVRHQITLSVGCVRVQNRADVSYTETYQQADRTLYQAKGDGKDRFIINEAEATEEPESAESTSPEEANSDTPNATTE